MRSLKTQCRTYCSSCVVILMTNIFILSDLTSVVTCNVTEKTVENSVRISSEKVIPVSQFSFFCFFVSVQEKTNLQLASHRFGLSSNQRASVELKMSIFLASE